MRKLYAVHASGICQILCLLFGLIVFSRSAQAQCWADFNVYQTYPYGPLCSPQYATLQAEYYNWNNSWVNGEFRWYTSDTDPYPVRSDYIASDFGQLTSSYSLYANNGTTMWVSFYDYNIGCESYRTPYTFYISPSAYLYQDYAKQCRYEPAKIQLSSNVSGVTFQLYKLTEYYDPWYGWVQNYQLEQSNTTGYFELYGFDPNTDQYSYFAKVYQPYSCSNQYYYQLYFDITGVSSPTITGNLSVSSGTSTTLYANGQASSFNWYDASNNLVNQGYSYTTPSTLSPNTYTYQVRGLSWDGTCLSDATTVALTVTLPTVDYTAPYTYYNFAKTIDLSKPVGTVAGSAGTTATGGASYTIPIYAPPGTNGMTPSIAINYNSQTGNGSVGFGWNISGLSAISRSGSDIYHDGKVNPVSYTNSDAFLLDGMRLTPLVGTNGANGTQYISENENFSRVFSTAGSPNNPYFFEVTTKERIKIEFGKTPDSRIMSDDGLNVVLWRINRITDINGNYTDFVYENGFRDSRISQIKYTGNAGTGLVPYNSISFLYKSRTDKNKVFEGGASLSTEVLLDKIVVINESTTVKEYQFNYAYDNLVSLLKEVIERGSDGTSLNSTIFLYGYQPQDIVTQSLSSFTGETSSGDFNGDGKSDILSTTYYNEDGIRYNSGYKIITDANSSATLYEEPLGTGNQVVENKKLANFLTSDFDKDGRDDVLLVNTSVLTYPSGNRSRVVNNFTIVYSTNTGKAETQFPASSYKYIHSNGNFLVPGDFDGDGTKDYICFLAPYNSSNYRALFTSPAQFILNQDIAGFSVTAGVGAISVVESDKIIPFDFNGDGKQELLITKGTFTYIMSIENPGYGIYTANIIYSTTEIVSGSKAFVGDFNGDGKHDVLVRNTNGSWKILYSTGTSFTSTNFGFNQVVHMTGAYSDDKIVVSDFNGDGKADILHGYSYFQNGVASSSKLSLYYSRGYGNSFYYEQYSYGSILPYIDLTVGDFNGDGRSDILSKSSYTSPADIIYFKPFGTERLLTKIMDGHLLTTTFNYNWLTNTTYPSYTRTVSLDEPSSHGDFNYVQLPFTVVSSVTTPDGLGNYSTNPYSYEDAVLHKSGKGFLGFKKVVSKQAATNTTSTTENAINTQFAVPYTVRQSTSRIDPITSIPELLSETRLTVSFDNLSTSSKRFFQKIDKTLAVNYLTGSASEQTNSYDAYGNVTTSTSKIGELSGVSVNPIETVTTTTTYGTYNSLFPARPDNVTVSKTRNGQAAVTSTTQFTYTSNGLISTQVDFANLPKPVTTTNTYNGFGNLTATTASAIGVSSRTTNFSYESKGRFALSKQIGAGTNISQSESFTYDSKWGKLLTATSSDCQTISYEYDGYGRLKKTIDPVFTVNHSLVWDVQSQTSFYEYTHYMGGRPDTKTWMDLLGRPIKTQTQGFSNQWLTKLTTYDAKGNVVTQTNSFYPNETPLITTNQYDNYNRLSTVSNSLNSSYYYYSSIGGGNMTSTATDATGQYSIKTIDATGKTISSTDRGGDLYFTYDSRGAQTEVKHGTTTLITNTYDAYGRQTSVTDVNAGTVSYDYDAFGQLTRQTDAKGTVYQMTYDGLGRITVKQGAVGSESTIYEYFKVGSCSNNALTKSTYSITGVNPVVKEYTYDGFNRLQSSKTTIDNVSYATTYAYDGYSNLSKTTYPSGLEVNRSYTSSGILQSVTGGNAGGTQNTLFNALQMDGYGHYTSYTNADGKTSQTTYQNGFPLRYYTQGVQDLNLIPKENA